MQTCAIFGVFGESHSTRIGSRVKVNLGAFLGRSLKGFQSTPLIKVKQLKGNTFAFLRHFFHLCPWVTFYLFGPNIEEAFSSVTTRGINLFRAILLKGLQTYLCVHLVKI